MKVSIKKISVKNFFSVGNKWVEVNFDVPGLFKVSGENLDNNSRNGSGKSTLFSESIMVGLLGKPIRKINVGDIPNTINDKKGCEIKLQLSVNNKEYMIYRGISPSFLKLYENYVENDELKSTKNEIQESSMKLMQKKIDDLICTNYNTLSHLLIMSNSYTSAFLDLTGQQRRDIVENILGISIFGTMAEEAKKIHSELKTDHSVTQKEYELSSQSVKNMVDNYEKLKEKAKQFSKLKEEKITTLKEKLEKLEKELSEVNNDSDKKEEIEKKIQDLKKFKEVKNTAINNCRVQIQTNTETKTKKAQQLLQIKDKPTCPTCGVETTNEHVQLHIQELALDMDKAIKIIEEQTSTGMSLKKVISSIDEKIKTFENQLIEIKTQINKIFQLEKEKKEKEKDLNEVENQKNDFSDLINEDELTKKKLALKEIETKFKEIGVEKEYYDYIRKLLSNDGIKSYIIKNIVKYWNSKINYYLKELNTDYSVYFNESLDAIIKSRNRDELEYHSFSGGEKARIDVAILLSVIDICKIQNSIDLNVMVIDELLDGGLDDIGREDVLNLFKNISRNMGKSIYVISHNNNLPMNIFDKEITLYKKNGFTFLNS